METDKNLFYQKLTIAICSTLEIEDALLNSFNILKQHIPIDGMTFDLTETDGSFVSIARVTSRGVEIGDITVPLSKEAQEEEKRNMGIEGAMIFNAPNLNPISIDYAKHFNMEEACNLVLWLDLGEDYLGGLAFHAFGQNIYTQEHAELFSLVKKPFSIAMSNALKHRELKKASKRYRTENRILHQELLEISGDRIVGAESGLKKVMSLAKQVSSVETPVLLLGDTGVGKEIIANAIHLFSKRNSGPLIKVNCGAIPENIIDSDLFGHEKGSFTGAVTQKIGKFERANGGTLFLDEVGELSLDAQVKLLRAIQFNEIERVGGSKTINVDVRIIAATNRDLEKMIHSGRFRRDLYFRLNVFPIRIPLLRERKEDIPALVQYLVEKKAKELNLYPPPQLADNAMVQLTDYDWPGNVRELSSVIERSLILNRQSPLSFNHLKSAELPAEKTGINEIDREEIIPLDEMISRYIVKALGKTAGRIEGPEGAAKLLNLHPNTLRSKIKKLKIQIPRSKKR